MKPASALITEFADLAANPTSAGQFIFTLGVPGGTFSYEKPAIAVTDTGMAMNAKGMVSTYSGFGVYLNACTDASAYTGVSFSIKGTLPDMKKTLNFRVQTSKNTKIDTVNKKGECVGTTYEECHDGGVDVINVADGARATARMGNFVLCHRIQQELQMPALMQLKLELVPVPFVLHASWLVQVYHS